MNNILERIGCHNINLGELLVDVGAYVDPNDDGSITLPLSKVPTVLGKFFLKLEQTFKDCEGKEFKIEVGDSKTADAFEISLGVLINFLKEKAREETAKVNPEA